MIRGEVGGGAPDPLGNKFPDWSPYNYVLNNPILRTDPDGRTPDGPGDWVYSVAGFASAVITDLTGGLVNVPTPEAATQQGTSAAQAFNHGEAAGHVAMLITGSAETLAGGTAEVAGGTAALTGAGTIPGVITALGGAAMVAHSTVVTGTALVNLTKTVVKMNDKNSGKNEKHGDGGRAKTKAEKQLEEYNKQLEKAPNKKERQRIEKKMENVEKDAAKKAKGEEHSKSNKQ